MDCAVSINKDPELWDCVHKPINHKTGLHCTKDQKRTQSLIASSDMEGACTTFWCSLSFRSIWPAKKCKKLTLLEISSNKKKLKRPSNNFSDANRNEYLLTFSRDDEREKIVQKKVIFPHYQSHAFLC